MQVFRDLQRVSKWYEPREFVTSVLERAPTPEVRELANELEKLLKNPPWDSLDEVSLDRTASWEAYCDALFRAYQEQALREVGKVPIVRMDKLSFPELWSCPEIPSAHRRSSAAR
jgi:hypothetical protein